MEVADNDHGTDFDLGQIDELVTRLMGHAFMAQAYGEALARDPSLTAGFGRLAAKHRSAVASLSSEIGQAATALTGAGNVAAPFAMAWRVRPA